MKYFVTFQDEEYQVFSPQYFYWGVGLATLGVFWSFANVFACTYMKKCQTRPIDVEQQQQQQQQNNRTNVEAPIIRRPRVQNNEAPPPYSEVVASQTTRWQRVRTWCGRGAGTDNLSREDRR